MGSCIQNSNAVINYYLIKYHCTCPVLFVTEGLVVVFYLYTEMYRAGLWAMLDQGKKG